MKTLITFVSAAAALSLQAAVGPDFAPPAVDTPLAWKASPVATDTAVPLDAWWTLFGDPSLDALVQQALAANQDLIAAAARVDQARAAAGVARSGYLPSVGLGASVDRSRSSQATDNTVPVAESTTYRGALDASWELDLFGRVRRLNESARASLEASAADFEQVKLVLTAEVAANAFTLRGLDQELRQLRDGVALRREALQLVQARREAGAATDFDVARAETELAATEAETAALANRRAAAANALAVLLGEAAPNFDFAATNAATLPPPPPVPVGLPSELLERRPDIVAAEATLAAANARIGVAKAAFFPAISLTGTFGGASSDVDRLFDSDARLWSIGPSLYLPIFQGGRNRANLERSRAVFDENVAVFRQRVLLAFREVQDALTATNRLTQQAEAQNRALAAARRAGQLAQLRYDEGFVAYFEVLDAQRTVLATERAATQLRTQRLLNSVALIKALGGGWHRPMPAALTALN